MSNILPIILLFCYAASIHAQITGIVTDLEGVPLKNVQVTRMHQDEAVHTTSDGSFSIQSGSTRIHSTTAGALRSSHNETRNQDYRILSLNGRVCDVGYTLNTAFGVNSIFPNELIASQVMVKANGNRAKQFTPFFVNTADYTPQGENGAYENKSLQKAALQHAIKDTLQFEIAGYRLHAITIDNVNNDLGVIRLSPDTSSWTRIFNGQNLDGWWIMGNPNVSVSNGQIVMLKTLEKEAGGGYLMTKKDNYLNFEIQFDCLPQWNTDGGIALRDICTDSASTRGDGWHCCIDYRERGPVGQIYYKDRSEVYSYWSAQWWFATKDSNLVSIKNTELDHGFTESMWESEEFVGWDPNEYQHFLIRFSGVPATYECFINGIKVNQYQCSETDPDYHDKAGRIGLQIVQDRNWELGKRMFYKNIFIREL